MVDYDYIRILNKMIRLANRKDIETIVKIYDSCRAELINRKIFQWTNEYPNITNVVSDIEKLELYVIDSTETIQGVVCLNDFQDKEYETVNWGLKSTKVLVVHRLAVSPNFQGKGCAGKLMDFAENFALENGFEVIRLDSYIPNKAVTRFYLNRGYKICGAVFFPGRTEPFNCYEKVI